MDTRLGTAADYVDLRFVKSRKVCQIVLEIPIEQAAAFVAAFGAPDPSTGVPVALARLQAGGQAPAKERKAWADLPPSQQAAIRCGEPEFQQFLHAHDADDAAVCVRVMCGVKSRSELNDNERARSKWVDLDDRFYCHRRVSQGRDP